MNNYELNLLPDWRYCNVQYGDKKPYPKDWQNNPLTLQQVSSGNIGVILGSHSSGLCAIDFDGEQAWDYWDQHIGINIADTNTVMWSSGKELRLQAAFTVPKDYWPVLKRKVINTLEFRWHGQSVLPPSRHPDGRDYIWLKKPSEVKVMELPEIVLTHWLNLILEEETKYDNIPKAIYDNTIDSVMVDYLLSKISAKVGNLRGEYDVWRTIAWATCHAIGINNAQILMMQYWPDKTKKEMTTLKAWKMNHRSPTIGTLIVLSGISYDERRLLEIQAKIRRLK